MYSSLLKNHKLRVLHSLWRLQVKEGKYIKVLAKIYWALFIGLIVGVGIGFFLAAPAVAKAPTPDNLSSIQPPKPPVVAPAAPKKVKSAGHSIEAAKSIDSAALANYLRQKGSPLADYSDQILKSPYWSTIIGICTIEEANCKINPKASNNFWGIGPGKRYATIPDGIEAINAFLAKAENKHPTIESLNGWYNQPGSADWLNTVISTKLKLENL